MDKYERERERYGPFSVIRHGDGFDVVDKRLTSTDGLGGYQRVDAKGNHVPHGGARTRSREVAWRRAAKLWKAEKARTKTPSA